MYTLQQASPAPCCMHNKRNSERHSRTRTYKNLNEFQSKENANLHRIFFCLLIPYLKTNQTKKPHISSRRVHRTLNRAITTKNYKEKIKKKNHARGITPKNIPKAALKFPTQPL